MQAARTMRRIGVAVFVVLLGGCQPETGSETVVAGAGVEAVETTTSSTSTSTTTSTTTTSTTVARPGTTVPVTRAATAAPPTTASSGRCDPNYAGACVPVDSDVDCAGGTGDGPSYVDAKRFQVIGRDIYRLDANNDGVACER